MQFVLHFDNHTGLRSGHDNIIDTKVLVLNLFIAPKSFMLNSYQASRLLKRFELETPYVMEVIRQSYWSLCHFPH